ncbi:MAG: glycosyltransferase, partial [Alphaproteobacteria bacterium]|nr:glycosyltransferase [Alphaproteobacteria bacterium]
MAQDSKTRRASEGVLQVVPALDAGGVERTAVDIAIAAAKAGYRSYIASRGGRLGVEAEAAGVHLLMLPERTKGPLRIALNARLLSSYIRDHGIALVHGRSRAPAWSAYFAARARGAHFVTTYAGIHRENFPGKRLYNAIMARGEIVIANSQYTADHIQKTYRTPKERVRVIPRGIDLSRFDPRAAEPARVAALRQAWGAGAQDRIVLLPARMTRWKGQSVMVEAARILLEQGQRDLIFVLAGETAGHETYLGEVWGAA